MPYFLSLCLSPYLSPLSITSLFWIVCPCFVITRGLNETNEIAQIHGSFLLPDKNVKLGGKLGICRSKYLKQLAEMTKFKQLNDFTTDRY